MSLDEKKPLLKAPSLTSEPKPFYFVDRTDRTKSIVKDDNEVEIVNSVSRQPSTSSKLPSSSAVASHNGHSDHSNGSSWFSSLFGGRRNGYQSIDGQPQAKPRKVPVKIEPKVFFANERTFLAWLHMSISLASISIAIIAFAEANSFSQIYGVLLMPVAIAFCAYSLWMYMKRATMIRRKDPGPYEDKTGPILLASMLGASILINFAVKLYDYST